ncbi:MAG: hypothetical protein A2Y77_05880 [Planctomycetes bacterium RBG_13_62_9]|nr:MAG: hypothetical protein A2Y77_05880 [Planctomycetes bacterium RBG_13_62_9]
MSKKVAVSIAVVLFVGANAFGLGAIDQLQNTMIGLGNTIQLLQGSQAANAIQNLAVCNSQLTTAACSGVAEQSLLANLAQIGHASGECAIVGVGQALTAAGMQAQLIGDGCDPKAQGQTLALAAAQELVKAEGPGAGSGLHQIVLREDQYAANNAGVMKESSAVLGLQSSDLTGAACATGTVDSTMTVTTTQSQAAL